jgi:hypothetical protein
VRLLVRKPARREWVPPRVPEPSSQASPTLDRFLGCEIVVSEVLRVPCNHCAFVVRLSASFAQRPAQTPAQSCALGRGFYRHLLSSASAAAPPPGLTAGPIAVDRQPFRHCEQGRGATALRVPRHRHQHRSRQGLLSFADSTGRRRSPILGACSHASSAPARRPVDQPAAGVALSALVGFAIGRTSFSWLAIAASSTGIAVPASAILALAPFHFQELRS